MKSLLIFILSCLTVLSVSAQTVTITVNGQRNRQVKVDERIFTVDNTATSPNMKTPIVLNDLQTGQHTLQLFRRNSSNTSTSRTSTTTFNLRAGYDLDITINGNGSVALKETRIRRTDDVGQNRTPMHDEDFNLFLQEVKSDWRQSGRMMKIIDAFENTNEDIDENTDEYFTTSQAMQLIQLITSQSNRLKLAKLVYLRITDPSNFTQMYSLLTTQAGKNDLAAYVRKHNVNTVSNNQYRTPMSDFNFNDLYSDVQELEGVSAKVTALNAEFANTSNYFTTAQARQLILLVNDENSRLHLAKTVYRGITNPANFSQIYDVLSSQANRNDLAAYVSNYYSGGYTNTYPAYKTPMTTENFNSLYSRIQNTWGLGAKMSELVVVFGSASNYFTTAQAEQLIRLVSSESNRLQLAKASYDNITDPTNFSNLYDVLNSQSSRDELAAFVNTTTGTSGTGAGYTTYKTPMSTANYNSLYSRIQNTWGLGAKMSALVDVFASTSDYFTTAQAEELIRLVSSESNRLQLAKSSYDNITDPANFSNLYDVLNSQSSRDELAAYVNTYSTIR